MKETFKLDLRAKISRWNGSTYTLWKECNANVELAPDASLEHERSAIELLCESMARALKDVAEQEQQVLDNTSDIVSIKQQEPVSPAQAETCCSAQADALRQE